LVKEAIMRIIMACCCVALVLLLAGSSFAQWQLAYQKEKAIDFQSVCFPTSTVGYVVGSGGVIFKTTNAGESWNQQTSPVATTLYRIYFEDAVKGWAVGVGGKIIKTTDGTNWTDVSGTVTTTNLKAVQFRGLKGWIGGLAGVNFYTTDGGTTWNPGTLPLGYTDDVNDIAFVSDLVGYAAVDGDGMMYTVDGGVNWQASTVSYGTYPYTRNDVEAVTALDDTHGVATGWGSMIGPQPSVILVTSDAGKTWTCPDPVVYHWQTFGYGYGVSEFDNGEVILCGGGAGSAGFVLHSTNQGTTWTRSVPITGEDIRDVCAVPGTPSRVVACGDEGTLALSKDKGQTWQFIWKPGPGFAGWLGATSITSEMAYIVGAQGSMVRLYQDEQGVPTGKWQFSVVSPNSLAPSALEDIWYINGVMYVCGANRYLCKSTDKGNTWTQLSHAFSATDNIYKMWWFDANNGFLVGRRGGQETIWKTTDGGVNLTEISYNITPVSMGWNSISFAPGNPLIGVICGDDNYILYTTDGGLNWNFATENIATGTLDCEEVHMTSATTGWIVGDTGTICKTTNGGATWTVQTPLSALSLMDVNFRNPDQPLYGWICGDDGSFYYTANGGTAWTAAAVPVGTSTYDVNTVHFQAPAGVLWAGADYGEAYYRLPDVVSAIGDPVAMPFGLDQNYPNPFNPTTTFRFTLPSQDFVTLNVYDVSGRLVSKVLSKEMTPGEHVVRFDAAGLVSGVYFYRLETSAGVQTKKMVLLQ
jgi:photosystem II stability/assembly factor-like uncharacterized protein